MKEYSIRIPITEELMQNGDLGRKIEFVKAFMDGLSQVERDKVRRHVASQLAPPPTGDEIKVHIFTFAESLSAKHNMPNDPHLLAEEIRCGKISFA